MIVDVDCELSFSALVFGVAYNTRENVVLVFIGPLLFTISRSKRGEGDE